MTWQTSKDSLVAADLKNFFGSKLTEAANRSQIQVSPMTLDYVSSVLVQFHETAKLFIQKGVKLPILSDILKEALEADLYRRITLLRQLGDTSLMVSGYFPEALNRRNFNLSYYYQMGGNAYSHLSDLSENQNVFDELSDSFVKLAELITSVSYEIRTANLSVLELLDVYAQSRSEAALQKLRDAGIHPLKRRDD